MLNTENELKSLISTEQKISTKIAKEKESNKHFQSEAKQQKYIVISNTHAVSVMRHGAAEVDLTKVELQELDR